MMECSRPEGSLNEGEKDCAGYAAENEVPEAYETAHDKYCGPFNGVGR